MHSKTEEVARRVGQHPSKHDAYEQHVESGEFSNPDYGPTVAISSREEYQAHVRWVLESPDTRSFTAYSTAMTWRQAHFYYHEPTNTAVIVPKDPSQPATAFRPKIGKTYFEERMKDAQAVETSIMLEARRGGIYALYPEPMAESPSQSTGTESPNAPTRTS